MTRAERALAHRWRWIALLCWLVALSGAVVIIWALHDREVNRADHLATEADRRGTAVTTLATDVRQLRSQLKAEGKTPVAPDPSDAVKNLPDRAEVPVPIPGPRGPAGPPGKADDGTDGSNGKDGRDGTPGADSTVPGPAGPAGPEGPQGPTGPPGKDGQDGAPGADGKDGQDGRDGQTCPDGYSLQPPPDDPDALVCRKDGAPAPEPDPDSSPQTPAALAPDRRRT
ncbi:collagen-like protein [Streptomyces antimycoticus]|uniref:collagen-like protein n=1 Tax=Streptomyces antimycoticus TaxID=68175 RepID=UPI00386488EE|nr:collagen-like protein [Streptomyces antimycoticus]